MPENLFAVQVDAWGAGGWAGPQGTAPKTCDRLLHPPGFIFPDTGV